MRGYRGIGAGGADAVSYCYIKIKGSDLTLYMRFSVFLLLHNI
ncbi:hypothetical protein HNP81_000960 [Peribacillus huizhouensis]|uniref:Uncharacterized protein n=1 Tax=Peribacillus huizhouensis TaxID=1501239 RepID=A0ABR6CMQ9_9BACI|nr:hypothetical protein [Peribacillus huizhouensis]